ncbi:MAG: hypothetical protein ACTSYT_03710 [Candidatus Asgardarchaeia archaeon]
MSEEDITKDLADLRAYLQKNIEETEEKINELKKYLDSLKKVLNTVDKVLIQKSFKPAAELVGRKEVGEIEHLFSEDGTKLADVIVTPNEVIITIDSSLTLKTDDKIFNSFIVNKVLKELDEEDMKLIREGKIPKESKIKYTVTTEEDRITRIIVGNYRTKKRLNRIVRAVEWMLEQIHSSKG